MVTGSKSAEFHGEAGGLLESKLSPPKPPFATVDRPRLGALLDQGLSRQVVSVCSPSGFGKTTAVAAWYRSIGQRCRSGWLSLDSADNEVSRFAAYFASAVHAAGSSLQAATLEAAKSGRVRELEPLFTRILLDLNAARGHGDGQYVLVLDDYHCIEAAEIREALKLFLRHLPAGMTLVILSRTEPDLGFSFLRTSGQILELGERELGFNEEEAMEFFGGRLQFQVGRELVRQALAKLEGWAAGLQLMSLSVSDVDSFRRTAEQFTGRERHVFDYLADNVLNRLPRELQRFLLRTSVLDRFDADLAARVSGDPDSHRRLMRLEKDHLFIVPLDRERNWYRYHHLFSDFLRHQLSLDFPGTREELHRSASDAWIARGDLEEAARQALASGLPSQVVQVLELGGWDFFNQGRLMLLTQCLDALPPDEMAANGDATLLQAVRTIDIDLDLDAMEPFLARAETVLPGKLPPGRWKLFRACFAALRALNGALAVGEVGEVERWARSALAELPPEETSMRVSALCGLGVVKLDQGELDASLEILRESQVLAEATGAVQMAIRSLYLQTYIHMSRGEFDTAFALQDEAISLCRRYCVESRATLDFVYQSRAWLHWELLELEKSEAICQEALKHRADVLKFPIHTQLSFIRLVQNDVDGAEYYARLNDMLMHRHPCRRRWLCDHDEVRVSLWARRGQVEALASWLVSQPPVEEPLNLHLQAQARNQARAHIALDQAERALPILDNMINASRRAGLRPDECRARAWQSVAFSALQEDQKAAAALADALELGAACRCMGSLLEIGEFLLPGLKRMVEGESESKPVGDARRLCKHLLRYVEQWSRSEPGLRGEEMPESARAADLTRKEWQVLSLIGEGLTNAQIAKRMFISPGTVKCHINRLYHKLQISDREAALKHANSLRDPLGDRRRAV